MKAIKCDNLILSLVFLLFSQFAYAQFGDGTDNPSAKFKKLSDNVMEASAGSLFSAALKTDGTLWVTGSNVLGQLGTGDKSDLRVFKKIAEKVVSVEASWDNLFFLKSDNTLWGCGGNEHGQLGTSNTELHLLPIKIFENVKSFAPGAGHLLILNNKNELWVLGENDSGQLADGTSEDIHNPKLITRDVLKIAAGQYHSVILKKDGTVWFSGSNLGEIVSTDSSKEIYKFIKIFDNAINIFSNYCSNSVYTIAPDYRLYGCGSDVNEIFGLQTKPGTFIPVADSVKSISLGQQQLFVIKLDGTLYGWAGRINNEGLLGDGTKGTKYSKIFITEDIVSIYSGIYHSLAITDTGVLLGTGNNGSVGLQ